MKNALLYMIFEGLAKGGNRLILLYIAYALDADAYLTFLLLFSFGTLLPVFVLSNYHSVLYILIGKYRREQVFSSILTMTMSKVLLFIVLIFLFRTWLYDYFNYHYLYTYIAIAISAFFFVYFTFLLVYHQLEEQHGQAIYLMSLPFFTAFLGALAGVTLFEDKVAGFFIGKSAGFLIVFFYFLLKDKLFTLNFSIDKAFVKQYLSRSKFLFLTALSGWLSGYGLLNIGKLVSTTENVVRYGYLLNLYMLFVLIANGINQVYAPRIRKLYAENLGKARSLSKTILLLYFGIGILAYGAFLVLEHFQYLLDDKIISMLSVFPYAVVVFLIASFSYISSVYICTTDSYKHFSLSSLVVDAISMTLVVYLLCGYNIALIQAYLLVTLARSGYTFVYVIRALHLKTEPNQI